MSEKEKKVRELSAEEVLQKFDKESDKRELTGVWGKIISAICETHSGCNFILNKLLTIVNLLYKFPIIFFFCNDSEPCEMEEKSRIMFT